MVPALFFGKSGTPGSVFARTVRKICTRGGESGKEIKAISCQLQANYSFYGLSHYGMRVSSITDADSWFTIVGF